MSEKTTPSNFITPTSIDNLSIAGISVWLICIVIESMYSNIDAFWIRFSALSISLIWSLSLFIKNKRWNKPSNYILILVNAALIYVNAAGLNTVTRQSPFEGKGAKTELDSIKANTLQHAGLFEFINQRNWYPDYGMIKYIDTLQSDLDSTTKDNERLKNLFFYFSDEIRNFSKEQRVIDLITDFSAQSKNDSSYLGKLRNHYVWQIDSLNYRVRSQERRIESYSNQLQENGQNSLFEKLLLEQRIDSLNLVILNYKHREDNMKDILQGETEKSKERIKYYQLVLDSLRKKRN